MKFFILTSIIILISIIFIVRVFAADINTSFLQPGGGGTNISAYIENLYKLALGIAGILAVGMIVVGAIYISVSGAIDKQAEGRDMIIQAIWGLVLLFSSYLILYTVNPELVNLKPLSGPDISCPPGTTKITTTTSPTGWYCKLDIEFASADCTKFEDLEVVDRSGFNDPIPTCKNRNLITQKKIELGATTYYDYTLLTGKEEIPPGSKIWVYPYFLKERGPGTNGCIIYAFKKPRGRDGKEQPVKMTRLKSNITPCAPQPQKIGLDEDADSPPSPTTSVCTRSTCACTNCTKLSDANIPVKTTGRGTCDLNADSTPKTTSCLASDQIIQKLRTLLQKVPTGWQVTESWPPTVKHSSACHYNGTCVDVALTTPPTNTSCNNLDYFIKKAQESGFEVLNEYTGVCPNVSVPPRQTRLTTGGHLHLTPK